MHIVRVNFDKADPPQEVIDAFREVQAARQERSTLQNRADAYANQTLAAARGDAAQRLQEAEGYRAQVVNAAQGEASRFTAVQQEYVKAPEVTRQRLYLEAMESVLGDVQMFLLDTPSGAAQGLVPYLPLNELRRPPAPAPQAEPARGDPVMARFPLLIGLLVVVGFLLLSSIFTVDERQKAMVLQFGQVKAIKEEPGLAFKIPFIQNVVYYDSAHPGARHQRARGDAARRPAADRRRLRALAHRRRRSSSAAPSASAACRPAEQRLEAILNANVREQLGSVRSEAVLSADRVGLMNRIRDQSIEEARALGVDDHRRAAEARRPARAEPRPRPSSG